MQEKNIDKLLKQKIQSDKKIPDEINQLFSDFGKEIKMKKKTNKVINYFKYLSTVAALALVCFGGGCTYAHINGKETPISPVLRTLGINSKYEQKAVEINEVKVSENIEVKMLNAAIDDTSLIVGYEITMPNPDMDAWIEVDGTYKLNNIKVMPINKAIDKDGNGKFIVYHLFDVSEIDLKGAENVELSANINQISEYTEYEDMASSYANYTKRTDGNWSFTQQLPVGKEVAGQEYTFEGSTVTVLQNVNISAKSLIKGTYTNILKIETNKEKYTGDGFDVYYKILDESGKEVVMGSEQRDFDSKVYSDRLVLGDIALNQKLTVQVYLKKAGGAFYEKITEMKVDLAKGKEVKEDLVEETMAEFKNNEYKFNYNNSWKELGIADANSVGPNSRYKGSLQIETSKNGSRVSVFAKEGSAANYLATIKNEYAEGYSLREEKDCKVGSLDGHYIVFEMISGDSIYLDVKYIVEKNNKVYEIDFFGTDLQYNNLQSDIEKIVSSFTIAH